jgi:hypothetical protein
VIGGADYERVVSHAIALQRFQHLAHGVVQNAGARVESGHVAARLRSVGDWGGRLDVAEADLHPHLTRREGTRLSGAAHLAGWGDLAADRSGYAECGSAILRCVAAIDETVWK